MEPTHENETKVEGATVLSSTLPAEESVVPQVGATGLEATPAVPFCKRHLTLIISIIVALAIIAGAGYFAYVYYGAKGVSVATVNGKHIYETELNESIALIEQSAVAQGLDVKKAEAHAEIEKQALEILINNALLITAARSAGVRATDADIQTKYDELVTELGSEEELTKRMAEIGLTEKKLRANIEERILADAYIGANTDINKLSVTDEEVSEFVKTISANDQKLPPLEEIRPQIEAQILGQKQQQVMADLIAKLRADAKIDVRTE